ncbi:MAG: fumarylacetoacetate hydrolase family protein [Propionibacteriaceae bacterium]|nr:fumarylacetoacetate hydrolase family protein [Propionibacteriaceae bacterium]
MHIARFSLDDLPTYGAVEIASDLGHHPDTIAVLAGDPLRQPLTYTGERIGLKDVKMLAPVVPATKVVCIGHNYADHVSEMGVDDVPPEPIVFFKPVTSVIGAGEAVIRPRETRKLNFEGELAIVFSRTCRRVKPERAAEVVFGYTVANDITCRDLQAKDGQWDRAKGFDTFCPLGPWIETDLTPAEVGNLRLRTSVNGTVRQDASTKLMLHDVAHLIAHVTAFTTMYTGDILLTGTPAGVGEILPGDLVSVDIEGIGTLTNPIMDEMF